MKPQANRQRLVYIIVGLVLGAIATSLAWAAHPGTADVRLAARVLDDGRVEVALQQRQATEDSDAASWGDLNEPTLRFLPADAERNLWHYSSELIVDVRESDADTDTDTDATQSEAADHEHEHSGPPAVSQIGPFEIVGTPTGNRPFTAETLFCAVTHGTPADFFWFQVYSAFADARYWNDINLRAEMRETGIEQAAAIDQCVDDGAAAIATTLADVDALRDSLDRATAAGVRVVTFNSGADQATAVGAAAHVALDEIAVGRMAAEEFEQREVAGDLLCILHEPANRGLEQRCDSLEANYSGGNVIRVRLAESEEEPQLVLQGHLTDAVGGALALNANAAYDLVDVVGDDHPDLVLAAVSADFPRPFAMLYNEQLSFVLWSHALEQGYHAITALLLAQGSPFPSEIGLFAEATQIGIQPSVITPQSVQAMLSEDNQFRANLPAWFGALERAIAGGSDQPEQTDASDDAANSGDSESGG